MTARAADDYPAIAARQRELAAERQAVSACTCNTAIGEYGEIVHLIGQPACPVHDAPSPGGLSPALGTCWVGGRLDDLRRVAQAIQRHHRISE